MPGAHTRLTTSELHRAIEAADYLCSLEDYLDRPTFIKIETLRADLDAECEDRKTMDLDARRAAKAATVP
jgi:hypothetical protein